jgi:hypothetical protein
VHKISLSGAFASTDKLIAQDVALSEAFCFQQKNSREKEE